MLNHMKTITIHVEEPVLQDYQRYARAHARTTADLIREAMVQYRTTWNEGGSVLDIEPVDLGTCLHPLTRDDDLLDEMIKAREDR